MRIGWRWVVVLALLGGCRVGSGGAAQPEGSEQEVPSVACPRPAGLDDPSRRVELAIAEPGFAYCDLEVYGPTEITDAADYARLVSCAEPPGRPVVDYATTRLLITRVRAPSEMLGATREADGRILVHVHAPGICSGVDWGDTVHVVALPNDGSTVEVSACVEPSGCSGGEYPP